MADMQEAPQIAVPDESAHEGSLIEAQNALLKMMEPVEETPETEEEQPTEEEESQPEEEDESLEEESEETSGEDSEEADEEVEEDLLYAVTVNGVEQEVTLEELMKGYSRQSDYTKKTQEVSQERKQIESLQQKYNSEVAQIQSERQQYMDNLQQIISNSAGEMEKFTNVDWTSLKESDPIEYVTKREELREAQEKIQSFKNEQQVVFQKQMKDTESMRKTVMEEEHKKLVSAIPEWSDPNEQKKLASNLRAYGLEQGFSAEELGSLIDHRSVLVLIKALKYDQMQNSDVKSKKLKNKPKVIRAGKGRSKETDSKRLHTAKMKRLQQTGHVNDAASLLEDMFNS